MNRKKCPECGSFDTDHAHTERHTDIIEESRICNDCPEMFVNKFSLFEQEMMETPGVEA